jgi:acyl-coenzyme A synthetase/AMP-(fatty) acid ligase
MTSGGNRNPAKAERGGIDGRERSAILMTESHRTRRFTVNATEPPRVVRYLDQLPRNDMGKVMKRDLKD